RTAAAWACACGSTARRCAQSIAGSRKAARPAKTISGSTLATNVRLVEIRLPLVSAAAHSAPGAGGRRMKNAHDSIPDVPVNSDERLAILAHELRTPLAALASAAEVLAQHAREPTIVRMSGIVSRQTAAMRALVDELLDAARVETGRLALHLSRLDLREVARSVVDDHRERFDRANLRCTLTVSAQPVTVNGDEMKLRQVLGNLLSNAINFTPAPGAVHVAVEACGDRACMRVRDTGVGRSEGHTAELQSRENL